MAVDPSVAIYICGIMVVLGAMCIIGTIMNKGKESE